VKLELERNKILRLVISASTILLCGWYLVCDLLKMTLFRSFIPYHPLLYCILMTVFTVAVCAAQMLYPPDRPYSSYEAPYFLDRSVCAVLLLPLSALHFFNEFFDLIGTVPALILIVISLIAAFRFLECCTVSRYAQGLSKIFFCTIIVFYSVIAMKLLFFPTSQKVLDTQRYHNANGRVAIVTQTRVFGQQVRTDVKVRECTPISLGLGRFEKATDEGRVSWTDPLDGVTPADIVWDGSTLYVNGEVLHY